MLTNSTRIDQLIQGGKLMLSLDDAISLALENNLNINIERFVPWIQETQLLKAKAGGIPQFGNTQQVVLGIFAFGVVRSDRDRGFWLDAREYSGEQSVYGGHRNQCDSGRQCEYGVREFGLHAGISHRHEFVGDV